MLVLRIVVSTALFALAGAAAAQSAPSTKPDRVKSGAATSGKVEEVKTRVKGRPRIQRGARRWET
jgi:hypothetical protein